MAAVVLWRVAGAPVSVKTELVEAPGGASDGVVLNASGYVVARRLATVSSKVTGRITEVLIEEGGAVQEGQVLARLDPATAQAEHVVASRSPINDVIGKVTYIWSSTFSERVGAVH